MTMDPNMPVGFNDRGDMTPFTQFNARGDVVGFMTNEYGDITPYEYFNITPDGSASPFTFDGYGNRLMTVGELESQPDGAALAIARQSATPFDSATIAEAILLL